MAIFTRKKRAGRTLALSGLLGGLLWACGAGPAQAGAAAGQARWKKRWVYVPSNLYVNENIPKLKKLFTRAQKAGYNGVLFTDYKSFTWWKLQAADRWKANAQKLRKITKDLGLELNVCVFPFGYAGALLFNDVNLANGTPIKDAPLVARGGRLWPEPTATIRNGSFEKHKGHKALGYGFQDGIGTYSFLDEKTAKDGKVSLRFENVGAKNKHGHARIMQKVKVRPWTQYRLRVWMKAEHLNGGAVKVLVLANKRTLQWQYLSFPKGKRWRTVSRVKNLNCDWIEQRVTFNSLDNTEVNVYLGQWGAKTGKIWWDDLRMDDVPTLNLLRRDSLPLKIVGEDGTEYKEGKDFERIEDKKMGRTPWPGSFETRHEPPLIHLTKNSRIKEGQKVRFSGCHATLVYHKQVNCSMSDPKVFELCALQMKKTNEALSPDGYFMSHDEIRSAGWEPEQRKKFKNTGELFAYNIKRCGAVAFKEGGGKPVYVWSDMFDPHHNAHANFYLVRGDIAGSWEGLDKKVIVMKWGGGKRARPGLQFFSQRGHRQMLAAYYDGDVKANHEMWIKAAEGVEGIVGTMYTTWTNNYANLEKFAQIWWGGGKQ